MILHDQATQVRTLVTSLGCGSRGVKLRRSLSPHTRIWRAVTTAIDEEDKLWRHGYDRRSRFPKGIIKTPVRELLPISLVRHIVGLLNQTDCEASP